MGIYFDGAEYEDQASFEAQTNPNVPQDIKKVYIQTNEPETAPKQAPEASRSVTDKLLGIGGERYQTWPERAVRSIIGAVALPGDVAQGNVAPDSIEAIDRAADLAGVMVGAPGPRPANSLGSFAGIHPKGNEATDAYRRMLRASVMESKGATPEEIWQAHQVFRGPEGRWRQEISDEGMKIADRDWKYGEEGKLSDFIEHPALYEAYPELKDVNFKVAEKGHDYIGGYNSASNTLTINPEKIRSGDEGILDVVTHELQHWIQSKEGFPRGSNPEVALGKAASKLREAMLRDDLTPEERNKLVDLYLSMRERAQDFANYMYQRVPGEVEANLSMARRKLSDQQRQMFSPEEMQKIMKGQKNAISGGTYYDPFFYPGESGYREGINAMANVDPIHLRSPEAAKIRLGQLLRDKAASKKAGDDVEGQAYAYYNSQIRELREFLKSK